MALPDVDWPQIVRAVRKIGLYNKIWISFVNYLLRVIHAYGTATVLILLLSHCSS